MKKIFKMMLVIFVYSLMFMLSNALMPYSEAFKAMNAQPDPMSAIYMFVNSVYVCSAIYYVMKHSKLRGLKLIFSVIAVFFFIHSFMTQIETLFFGHAFSVLTTADIVFIMIAGIIPTAVAVLLIYKLFGFESNEVHIKSDVNIKQLIIKIALLSIIYMCVYFFFGYFVAWQFEALRIFYSGSAEKLGFAAQLMNNLNNNPVIYPFQILRGVLFVLGILPLYFIMDNKKSFIASVCLVFLCTAIVLIIPNVLFPDTVRIAHLLEMSSSMLLFGLITGYVLSR